MQHAIELGPVTVWPGQAAGKYPDGNQVIVRGTDTLAVLDTPLVAQELPGAAGLDDADLIILGHVHEDHMTALGRLQRVPLHVHAGDVEAARSWPGLAAHYGYPQAVLDELQRAKPASAKGRYLKKITVSSTMGPGVKVDTNRLKAEA